MHPARSVALLVPFLRQQKVRRVLDYGAGTLRNALFLADKGFDVDVAEKKEYLTSINKRYQRYRGYARVNDIFDVSHLPRNSQVDLVICTYVLNILDEPDERKELLGRCFQILRPAGLLFLEIKEKRSNLNNNALSLDETEKITSASGFENYLWWRGRICLAGLFKKRE